MAHYQKYTRGAVKGLLRHDARSEEAKKGTELPHSNTNINPDKTALNYDLAPQRDLSMGDFIKQRCSEARTLNRKDVNVMCSWVVTLPQNVKPEDEEKFFRAAYAFLSGKYGERNTVSAWVHKDETTPHLHFCWVPVVPDEKRGGERVSAHDCVTRKDLKTFHTELSKHIEQTLGYETEILNEATRNGNRSVAELKRETSIKRLKALNNDLKAKEQACLEYGKVIGQRFEPPKNVKENLFGNKVTLPKEEYEKLCRLARLKGKEVQEKIALEVLLSERRELDSYKSITEAQNQAKQAASENARLRDQIDTLYRELKRILTAHPEIKKEREREKERERSLSGRGREIG